MFLKYFIRNNLKLNNNTTFMKFKLKSSHGLNGSHVLMLNSNSRLFSYALNKKHANKWQESVDQVVDINGSEMKIVEAEKGMESSDKHLKILFYWRFIRTF